MATDEKLPLTETPYTEKEVRELLSQFVADHGIGAYEIKVKRYPNGTKIVQFSVGFKVRA